MSRVSLKILKIYLILQQIRINERTEKTYKQYGITAIKFQDPPPKQKVQIVEGIN